ncbi:hypothetical protein DW928_06090 [Firmicutes bacterium AM43-11BH]|uniref:Uncharacterized protein n=1 Tax=Ruminococcus hominis TaxID=2763065 RepID=A0ABR7GAQ3_9FIRM|nr:MULTISPECIES: hypothetical protein [Clostridia]RGH39079.1 hypothetical protein DW901_09705 [Firmicutes bacterium AM41-5BH]RHS81097.1 hypothetical protein DW928_06090 [Firmicutes bacterium AM43-11BH]RHV03253.1 hypothetical protein DXB97_10575 [Firmicutes bacterium OM07-11]MBC5684183.1 hypothetical protein [Ruminococcus hominis]MCH4280438.1 hypothetical protein [Mediterraneibacter sp. NSJ-151]
MLGVLAVLLVAVGILAASFIKKGENATMVLNKDGSYTASGSMTVSLSVSHGTFGEIPLVTYDVKEPTPETPEAPDAEPVSIGNDELESVE